MNEYQFSQLKPGDTLIGPENKTWAVSRKSEHGVVIHRTVTHKLRGVTQYVNQKDFHQYQAYAPESPATFSTDLRNLINRYSRENGSNTPDFILAEYLEHCLLAFEMASNRRSSWYGLTPKVVPGPPPNTIALTYKDLINDMPFSKIDASCFKHITSKDVQMADVVTYTDKRGVVKLLKHRYATMEYIEQFNASNSSQTTSVSG